MNILFEDADVIVCEKPAGLLSQEDSRGGESMVSRLREHTGGEVYPVHRLDRAASGLMVYAKTPSAAAALGCQMAGHGFVKEYLVQVHGLPEPPAGRLTDLLFYDRRAGKSYVVGRMRAGVKAAALTYETVAALPAAAVLRVRLETGRTHQIRVQLASRGMPLFGDRRYGAPEGGSLALCSCRLAFDHPTSGRRLDFAKETTDFFRPCG